jgi:CopG family nickel-responsive transcriptional regulator
VAKAGRPNVSELVRFTVSLEADLLEQFDHYVRDHKLATRSEAIRQLLRETLTEQGFADDAADAAATLTIVYDHHKAALMEKLMHLQHEHAHLVVSTMHVHLDHDLCLEVIALRGRATQLQQMAAALTGLKGIHLGKLVMARSAQLGHTHEHLHDGEHE